MIWDNEKDYAQQSEDFDSDAFDAVLVDAQTSPARSKSKPLRIVIALLWLGVLGAGLYLGLSTGWLAAQLRPRTVMLRGAEMCTPAEALAALDCNAETTLAQLAWRSLRFQPRGERWLTGLRIRPAFSRDMVIEVQERRPLALLHCGEARGWLCDDGMVVAAAPADTAERFKRISALPPIILPPGYLELEDSGRKIKAAQLADSDSFMQIMAACVLDLPGQVRCVKLSDAGLASLICSDGLEVRLGHFENLPLKLAALPKSLRLCADSRSKLRYLDASDSGVFYQKWKQATQTPQ